MAAAEVEKVEGLLDRINRIYRIELEEAFDVGDDDLRTAITEVGADPIRFGRACRDKSLCAADWIVATLGHTKTNEPPRMDGSMVDKGWAKNYPI